MTTTAFAPSVALPGPTICYGPAGDWEPHHYVGDYCKECAGANPNHTHRVDSYYHYDNDTHWKVCGVCGEAMGAKEEHTFENSFCTVCRMVDPQHHCLQDSYYYYSDNNGHWPICRYCQNPLPNSSREEHTFSPEGICTVCGFVSATHQCKQAPWYNYDDSGHWRCCEYCWADMSNDQVTPHTMENDRCTVCGYYSPTHTHNLRYYTDRVNYPGMHLLDCSICFEQFGAEKHTLNEADFCTVCGAMGETHQNSMVMDASLRVGSNKEMILTLTFADDTSLDMTITDTYIDFSTRYIFENNTIVGRRNIGNLWTDKGMLEAVWYTYDDGRSYIEVKDVGITTNTITQHEWLDAYYAFTDLGVVDLVCTYKDGVWTGTGHNYDGRDITIRLDAQLKVTDNTVTDPAGAAVDKETDSDGTVVIKDVEPSKDGNMTVVDVSDNNTSNVKVSADVVKKTVESDKPLLIKLDDGGTQVKITPKAMEKIQENCKDLTGEQILQLSVTKPETPSEGNQAAFDKIQEDTDNAKVIRLDLSVAGESVFDESNASGTIRVTIPVDLPAGCVDVIVYYINGDTLEKLSGVTLRDGKITADLEHFSEYVVVPVLGEGQTVSGSVKSFGDDSEVTIRLIRQGETEAAYEQVIASGTASGLKFTGSYSFANVAAGTYTLQIIKKNHVTREYTITVGEEAVQQDGEIWLLGDVTGDGRVNIADQMKLTRYVNNPSKYPLGDFYWNADVTGDGKVNIADQMKLTRYVNNPTKYPLYK